MLIAGCLLAADTWPQFLSNTKNTFNPDSPQCEEKLEYSLCFTGLYFMNWSADNSKNNFLFLQNIRYSWWIESRKKIRFSNQWINSFSFQIYPDSIARIQTDENNLHLKIDIPLTGSFTFGLKTILSSRLFNGYDYQNDSGHVTRVLNSAFLTPLTGNFSGGFCWKFPSVGTLMLGLSSLKITYIRDRNVYLAQNTTVFYGVPKNKRYLLEYGLSLQMTADCDLLKWMHWTCDFLLFQKQNSPWDLNLKNQFSFRLTRYLKINLRTRIIYEEQISRKLQLENVVSAGINLSGEWRITNDK